jgi:hypothetical protein
MPRRHRPGNPPAEFDAFVRAEIAEWGKLIRDMKLAAR